jgi:prepilin-type processing-associated H-X9-DG protein
LRQIGIALHQFHDRARKFPRGLDYPPETPEEQIPFAVSDYFPLMGWHTRLLPYVEQEALWRRTVAGYAADWLFNPNTWDFQTPNIPHVGLVTPVELYICPSDGRSTDPRVLPGLAMSYTSYLGVSGTNHFRRDGMLFKGSDIRMADVTDGSSTTLFVGERPPVIPGFGVWYGGRITSPGNNVLGIVERGASNYAAHLNCEDGPYRFSPGTMNRSCDAYQYWSLHSGGGHFLFVDGAVRFITYSAADKLPALATRASGEVAELPE